AKALRCEQQVVDAYPVLAHLPEALFWRADLFAHTRLDNAPPEVHSARRETAIGYYAAHLENGNPAHRSVALVGRAGLQQEAGRLQSALADYDAAIGLERKLATDPDVVRARVAALQGLG